MMKSYGVFLRTLVAACVCLQATACSSDNNGDDGGGNGAKTFAVMLNDKNYAGSSQRLLVPFDGAEYVLNIKTGSQVTWQVDLKEMTPVDFLKVTPVVNGKGEETITITAAKNAAKEGGHIGTVVITNSSNTAVMTLIFDQKEKALVFPAGMMQKPEAFYDKESTFNVFHMVEGPNVAILYDKAWGSNPEMDIKLPLDRAKAIEYAEDVYTWMIDEGGFANWTTSEAAKYKLLVLVHHSAEGGATGYGKPNVGITEVKHSGIMKVNKYGVPGTLQHEIMHCFQYITHYDGGADYGWAAPIYEMGSQWALTKRFPDWPDLEYPHLIGFLRNTHRAFLHEENQYHSPYVLIYWEFKHPMMVSKLWQGNIAADKKDPVVTYKRLNNLTQEEFNDEMFEGVSRFVTWDIPHMKEANVRHIDKHTYKLTTVSASKFKAAPETCPQNYGYNCIKLKAPAAGKTVTIEFRGNMNLDGYKIKNSAYKGWRYGFVALKENGERIYGEINKEESKRISFTVPTEGIKYLWFVVMGAPSTHFKHIQSTTTVDNENNWPYEFTLNGTTLDTPTAL